MSIFYRIFLSLLIVVLIIGGGAWSVDRVLHSFGGFDRLRVGQWEAFPQFGTLEADPYAKARAAELGILALGKAEGLAFTLWRDETAGRLQRMCTYKLEGTLPEASFFTLYSVDSDGIVEKPSPGRPSEITSDNVLRMRDGGYRIMVSSQPQSGNWLAIEKESDKGGHQYGLVLTLYDTPMMTTTGIAKLDMPHLTRVDEGGCE